MPIRYPIHEIKAVTPSQLAILKTNRNVEILHGREERQYRKRLKRNEHRRRRLQWRFPRHRDAGRRFDVHGRHRIIVRVEVR